MPTTTVAVVNPTGGGSVTTGNNNVHPTSVSINDGGSGTTVNNNGNNNTPMPIGGGKTNNSPSTTQGGGGGGNTNPTPVGIVQPSPTTGGGDNDTPPVTTATAPTPTTRTTDPRCLQRYQRKRACKTWADVKGSTIGFRIINCLLLKVMLFVFIFDFSSFVDFKGNNCNYSWKDDACVVEESACVAPKGSSEKCAFISCSDPSICPKQVHVAPVFFIIKKTKKKWCRLCNTRRWEPVGNAAKCTWSRTMARVSILALVSAQIRTISSIVLRAATRSDSCIMR